MSLYNCKQLSLYISYNTFSFFPILTVNNFEETLNMTKALCEFRLIGLYSNVLHSFLNASMI